MASKKDAIIIQEKQVYKKKGSKKGVGFVRVALRAVMWLSNTTFKEVVVYEQVKLDSRPAGEFWFRIDDTVNTCMDSSDFIKRFRNLKEND